MALRGALALEEAMGLSWGCATEWMMPSYTVVVVPALDGGKWPASRSGRFTPEGRT
jgi:hypothetical protein